MSDAKTVWKQVCAALQLKYSPAVYNTWIVSNPLTELQPLDDTKLHGVITSPTGFHSLHIKKNFEQELIDSLKHITGKEIELEFIVGSPADRIVSTKPKSTHSSTPRVADTVSPRVEDLFSQTSLAQSAAQRAQLLAQRIGLKAEYTFENFAVSSSNEMAHAAALAVSQRPGQAYNPLFLYGDVGVGKTHLMHAIGNNLLKDNPQFRILYCTGETFTNDIVGAIQNKKTMQFKNKYRGINALLLDDVQFIAGKNTVQEEFFHTFNALVQAGNQIVLTSDRPPQEISLLEDRLRSRFQAGLMIDIQNPSFELRTAIVLIKAKSYHLTLDMQQAQQIAETLQSARQIEGLMLKLRSAIELQGKNLDQSLIGSLLNTEQPAQVKKRLRVKPQDIIKTVAAHYHVKQIELKGKGRQKHLVQARHSCMLLLKNMLQLPLVEIGHWLGGRDHSTVIHGISKMETLLTKDSQVASDFRQLTASIEQLAR